MKKGDKYIFKGGYSLCKILKIEKNKIHYHIILANFDSVDSKKEFLKIWEAYSPEDNKNTVD
jgi:hypothetical protein